MNLRDVYGGCNEINNYQVSPSTTIVCTHIAAKVDVRWNLVGLLNTYPDAKVANFLLTALPAKGYYFNDELADGTKVGHTLNSVESHTLYATGRDPAKLSPANVISGRQDF